MAGTIITVIALCMLAFGTRAIVREHRWLRQAQVTRGQVISLTAKHGRKTTTYYPRVQYIAQGGNAREFEGSVGSRPPSFQVDQPVMVAYEAGEDHEQIVMFGQCYGGWSILVCLALLALFLRVVFLVGSHWVPRIYLPPGESW